MGRLFSSREAYNRVIHPEIIHPFTRESIIISTNSPVELSDFPIKGL